MFRENKIKSEIYKCFPIWQIQLQTFLSLKCMKSINPKQNNIFNCVKHCEKQSLWKMPPITVLCFMAGYIFYEGFSIRKKRYFVHYLHTWKAIYVFTFLTCSPSAAPAAASCPVQAHPSCSPQPHFGLPTATAPPARPHPSQPNRCLGHKQLRMHGTKEWVSIFGKISMIFFFFPKLLLEVKIDFPIASVPLGTPVLVTPEPACDQLPPLFLLKFQDSINKISFPIPELCRSVPAVAFWGLCHTMYRLPLQSSSVFCISYATCFTPTVTALHITLFRGSLSFMKLKTKTKT